MYVRTSLTNPHGPNPCGLVPLILVKHMDSDTNTASDWRDRDKTFRQQCWNSCSPRAIAICWTRILPSWDMILMWRSHPYVKQSNTFYWGTLPLSLRLDPRRCWIFFSFAADDLVRKLIADITNSAEIFICLSWHRRNLQWIISWTLDRISQV
jgi:hypothetical protein